MNRPLWLDIVYLALWFTPCGLGAYALAAFSMSHLGWPRWSFVPVYIVFFLALVIGGLFILAVWQRWRRENK
jgi:ABC-type multidrug transport system permease subunit